MGLATEHRALSQRTADHDDDIFVTLTLFPPQAQAHRSHEARRPQHTPTPHTAPRGYTTTEGGAQVTFSIQHGIKVSRAFGDLGSLKIDNRDLREGGSTTSGLAIVHFGSVGRLWGLFEHCKAT